MIQHQTENPGHAHPIAFSFADFSYWCYACDSYVVHPLLTHSKFFHKEKFAEDDTNAQIIKKIKDSEFKEELKEVEDEEDEDDSGDEAPKPSHK